MPTAQFTGIIIFLYLIILITWAPPASSSSSSSYSSIYEALASHGLPQGLFPKGVMNYTLDSDGRFEVHLDQACNAKFESELHYDRNVTGLLTDGKISNLTGISAQELFLWFPVRQILVDVPSSGLIYFDVGVVFKQFSLSLFDTPPECVAGAVYPNEEVGREEEIGPEEEVILQVVEKKGRLNPKYPNEQEVSASAKQSM